jgi:hypothetical protein
MYLGIYKIQCSSVPEDRLPFIVSATHSDEKYIKCVPNSKSGDDEHTRKKIKKTLTCEKMTILFFPLQKAGITAI